MNILIRLAVVAICLGLVACASKPLPVSTSMRLTPAECDQVTQAALSASSHNDTGASTLLMMVAKKGGCF